MKKRHRRKHNKRSNKNLSRSAVQDLQYTAQGKQVALVGDALLRQLDDEFADDKKDPSSVSNAVVTR